MTVLNNRAIKVRFMTLQSNLYQDSSHYIMFKYFKGYIFIDIFLVETDFEMSHWYQMNPKGFLYNTALAKLP